MWFQPWHEVIVLLISAAYVHVGCWNNCQKCQPLPSLEGTHPYLNRSHHSRQYKLLRCYNAAKEKKMSVFALRNGGMCAGSRNLIDYTQFGEQRYDCEGGKGGKELNNVYQINYPPTPGTIKMIWYFLASSNLWIIWYFWYGRIRYYTQFLFHTY